MKLLIKISFLLFTLLFLNSCCGDCDEINNTVLKIQVFDKTTKANITNSLDAASFIIAQLAPESPVLLPALEFKETEIIAQFPVICSSRKMSGTMDITIKGSVREKMVIAIETTTKSCCACSQTRGTIKSLTTQQGGTVSLGLNSNTLRIEI